MFPIILPPTQEPFDSESMPSDFLEELTTDREENQLEDLNHCLRAFNLDRLLGTLYEFIETYVKHSPSNEKEWPYVECLPLTLNYELNCVYANTLQVSTCTWLAADIRTCGCTCLKIRTVCFQKMQPVCTQSSQGCGHIVIPTHTEKHCIG